MRLSTHQWNVVVLLKCKTKYFKIPHLFNYILWYPWNFKHHGLILCISGYMRRNSDILELLANARKHYRWHMRSCHWMGEHHHHWQRTYKWLERGVKETITLFDSVNKHSVGMGDYTTPAVNSVQHSLLVTWLEWVTWQVLFAGITIRVIKWGS